MEKESIFLTLHNYDTPRKCEMLKNWYNLTIPLKLLELEHIKVNKEHPGYYLKMHRLSKNLSMSKLAKEINSCRHKLEAIENGKNYARWETSKKLAQYFKLDTVYFYDQYLEEIEDIHIKLNNHIKSNNTNVIQLSNNTGIDVRNLRYWIKGRKKPSRESYYKLKEHKII